LSLHVAGPVRNQPLPTGPNLTHLAQPNRNCRNTLYYATTSATMEAVDEKPRS